MQALSSHIAASDSDQLPLVSVVTPSYNQAAYISATIESVLGQNYPHIEHWVIDGGSNDGTLDILRRYEHDPRFRWVSEADRGQSDAINKGWARARGTVLAWLNSDDTYLPGALRAQVAALQANPDCGLVYGDVAYIDQDGQLLFTLHGRPFRPAEVLRMTIPIQPSTFLRRAVYEQIGPLDLSFRYSMDSEYWSRAMRVTRFHYQPGVVATYRLHAASKTIGQSEGFYREWQTLLDRFFADQRVDPQTRAERAAIYADVYLLIAATELRQGSARRAHYYLLRSLQVGGPRRRLLALAPALADRLLPGTPSMQLLELWGTLRRYARKQRTASMP